jgi:MoaA/NifB/PqqE/SkfB family radical SAM enzyme
LHEFLTGQDLIRGYGARLPPSRLSAAVRWLRDGGPVPRPISVHVDLTFRCTARCVHCAQWTWRERPEMDLDKLNHLVMMLRRWDVRSVTVGGGNPLLHEHLNYFLRSLRESGISIGLITEGGTTLNAALITALDEYLSWIRFSLDGATAEVHDRIRGRSGLFDLTTEAIRELCARKSQLEVAINCVIQRRNLHQLAEMVSLSRALGIDILMFKIPHGHDPRGRYVPNAEEWQRVREWVQNELIADQSAKPSTNLATLSRLLNDDLELTDLVAGRPVRQYYTARNASCFVPLFFLVIDAEGNVFPCDYLQADTRPDSREYHEMRSNFVVGNVFTHGDSVLDRLGTAFREKVHSLPGRGYEECGSCTRFFELNTFLSAFSAEQKEANDGSGALDISAVQGAIEAQFL